MSDTTARAAEALARALIRAGIWVDADDPGLASPQEYAAVMLADEDITDSERAALVAALLDGHETVLSDAICRWNCTGTWHSHEGDAHATIAFLKEMGNAEH